MVVSRSPIFAPLKAKTAFGCLISAALFLTGTTFAATPLLPRAYVNTAYPTMTGSTIHLASGGDLQAALNNATCGNTIALAPGASFVGNFTLPRKTCTGTIVVITDLPSNSMPAQGVRMTPSLATSANLAKIVTPNSVAAISTENGSANYRVAAVQVTELSTSQAGYSVNGTPSALSGGLITLGSSSETVITDQPNNIVIDRAYIWARSTTHCKRGVTVNGRNLAVIDSYIEGVKGVGQDTQAIIGWSGVGPFKIVNNYLEAAGENILFGGGDPRISGLTPSDIEIRGNYIYKPLSWQNQFNTGGGVMDQWSVKNGVETKNAKRILFEGNVIENVWAHAQVGYGFVLKPANQDGSCTWCTSQDLIIRNNILSNTGGGMNLASSTSDDTAAARFHVENNLLYKVAAAGIGTESMIQVVGDKPFDDLTIEHNTLIFDREITNMLTLETRSKFRFYLCE